MWSKLTRLVAVYNAAKLDKLIINKVSLMYTCLRNIVETLYVQYKWRNPISALA